MKLLRATWFVGRWLAGCFRDFGLTVIWFFLLVILAVQIGIVTSHQLPVPDWLLRRFESRIAPGGWRVHIGGATADPAGRLLLSDLELRPPGYDEALAHIDTVYVRLDPLALAHGSVVPRRIVVRNLDLLLPALLSPTGKTEPVLTDIRFAIRGGDNGYRVSAVSGRLDALTFAVTGEFALPAGAGRSAAAGFDSGPFLRQYRDIASRIVEESAQLAAFDHPRLTVHADPAAPGCPADLVFTADHAALDLSARSPTLGTLTLGPLRLATQVNLKGGLPPDLAVDVRCGSAEAAGCRAEAISAHLAAALGPDWKPRGPISLNAAFGSVNDPRLTLQSPAVRLVRSPDGLLTACLDTLVLGSPWHLDAQIDPAREAGRIRFAGALTEALVREAAGQAHLDADSLLRLPEPAPLSGSVSLAPGWKFASTEGRFETGPIVAVRVPFDQVAGNFSFEGSQLNFTHLTARQGENSAHGSYWMDTQTRDFRILVAGVLRPMDISDFFDDWWSHFWRNFDFTPAPPQADVAVTGRWGAPYLCTVFVNVDADHPAVRGVHFDHLDTTLFIRPDFYHAIDLRATVGDHLARGWFTRAVDLYRDTDDLKSIDFDFVTNLDLTETAKLFGQEGIETLEPFRFSTPPSARLLGHIDGPASPHGSHRLIQIAIKSTGDFYLYNFPLKDVAFHGTISDDEIELPNIRVSFAGGQATGSATLNGTGAARRLSFDAKLNDALLGEAISSLEQYSAREHGEPPPKQSRFQQKIADGRMNLQLAAQGLFDDPYSFYGHGSLDLHGAQLAQVNLLGALSQLLKFTTLQLNDAHTSFVLERDHLFLPDLRITGASTIIEARGSYFLDRKQMEFDAKVYPFGKGKTLLANAVGFVLVPVTNALELKLNGSLDRPNWRFALGPTSVLYNLTGAKPPTGEKPQPSPNPNPRPLPAPYLRR